MGQKQLATIQMQIVQPPKTKKEMYDVHLFIANYNISIIYLLSPLPTWLQTTIQHKTQLKI